MYLTVKQFLYDIVNSNAISRKYYARMKKYYQSLCVKYGWHILSEPELRELLVKLGFKPGAVVMIHSSWGRIAEKVPSMGPSKFIGILLELLGEEGTLLMPTIPFAGSQAEYIKTHKTFDPKKAPTMMGMVPELFRRRPDVTRSLHPTHSVAGWGKHADELLKTHHLGTAFGENSPYYKMKQYDGVVVSVGVHPKDSIIVLHVPEELHPKTYEYHYEKTACPLIIKNGEEEIHYDIYPLRSDRERNFGLPIGIMIKEGVIFYKKHKGLEVSSVTTDAFIKRGFSLIEEGRYT